MPDAVVKSHSARTLRRGKQDGNPYSIDRLVRLLSEAILNYISKSSIAVFQVYKVLGDDSIGRFSDPTEDLFLEI